MTFRSSTRLLVVSSTLLACSVEAFLGTTYTPQVLWIAAAGFLLLLMAGRQLGRTATPVVMASLYLAPSILLVTLAAKGYEYDAIWILPLLGLVLSDRRAWTEWSMPARWQWPLITWSAIVAISWPIVFLREADFALWILPLERVSNTSIGISPWLIDQNVTYFAIGHNLGILVLDWLCRTYRDAPARFRREVLTPMMAAAGVAAAVSAYQGFVDLGFLNDGFWEYMIRATGTLGDANKLGNVAAFWTAGALVYAQRTRRLWQLVIPVAALMLGITAVWLSGSRTGLAAIGLSLTIAVIETLRSVKLDRRKLAIGGGGALVIGAVMIVVLQNASTHTIVQRGTLGYIPFIGDRGIGESANELLWDRFGYGPAAIQMIKEHPIAGVGPGMYHSLYYDFGEAAGRILRAPDNAQAWWRHNLAELGFIAFVPVVWWCIVFGRQLFGPASSSDRLITGILRGSLIGFFVASIFGVPSQSVAITLTFWVFVFWFHSESSRPETDQPATPLSRPLVIAATAMIAIHGAMTAVDAAGDLRPRNRAQRFDWYYRYGYCHNSSCIGENVTPDDVEPDPGGNTIGRRWTMKKSLAVIAVKGQVLKFVAWIDHPDSDVRPVHTQIWADSKLVYEGDLRRTPIFLDIPATAGKTHMIIETAIDRTFKPSDAGNSRDRRDLGLSIRDWVWE